MTRPRPCAAWTIMGLSLFARRPCSASRPIQMKNSNAYSDARIAALVFTVSLAAYAALCAAFQGFTPDGFVYMELAKNIPESGYKVLGEPHEKFLPLYPALMALFNLVTAKALGVDFWGYAISVTSGAVLPPIVFLMAGRMGTSRTFALFAAVLQALSALGLHQYADVNVIPLFTALLMAALFLAQRENYFWAGVAAGLAATTRYEVYLLLPIFLLINIKKPGVMARAAAGFILAASPWYARNLLTYGHLIHTYYMAEMTAPGFHLFGILEGLLTQTGPVILVAAAFGLKRIDRGIAILFASFIVLYIGLHSWWWWYSHRFLLTLNPIFLVMAAPGLESMIEALKKKIHLRPRLISGLTMAGAAAPVVFVSIYYVAAASFAQPDPYCRAAMDASREPPAKKLIGSSPLMLEYYGKREAFAFDEIKEGEDPHEKILRRYLQDGVRLAVWMDKAPLDVSEYGYLAGGKNVKAAARTASASYDLYYIFIREYVGQGKNVYLYELKAREVKVK